MMVDQKTLLRELQGLPINPTDEAVLTTVFDIYTASNSEVKFVQLGAYDGSGDIFQEKYLWPDQRPDLYGILVEPSPAAFGRLKLLVNNRMDLATRVTCINKAVHPIGKTELDFYQVDELMLFQEVGQEILERYGIHLGSFQRISSLDRQHLVKHFEKFRIESKSLLSSKEFLDRFSFKISVETISVSGLIDSLVSLVSPVVSELDPSESESLIDLLIVDVEGVDLSVMESFFAAGIFPKIIMYEDVHLDLGVSSSLLLKNDYKNIKLSGYNSLGVRLM